MTKEVPIDYTLLENGLDFIHQSLIEFKNVEAQPENLNVKKLIKYSILHLSSGIELILKDHLLAKDWTYVFAKIDEANEKNLESGNFQSVNLK